MRVRKKVTEKERVQNIEEMRKFVHSRKRQFPSMMQFTQAAFDHAYILGLNKR